MTYWKNIFEINHNEKTQIISLRLQVFSLVGRKEEALGYFFLHCARTLGTEHIDLILLLLIMELILPRKLRQER